MRNLRGFLVVIAVAVPLILTMVLWRSCSVDAPPQVVEIPVSEIPESPAESESPDFESEEAPEGGQEVLAVLVPEKSSSGIIKKQTESLPEDIPDQLEVPVPEADPEPEELPQPEEYQESPAVSLPEANAPPKPAVKPYRFALKTNLLADLLITPNIEIEFPFARDRFSVMGELSFPWLPSRDRSWCYELLYGGAEMRWWFQDRNGREALTGHFFGAFAGGGYYDFERKGKGYQGEGLMAGLSYGYSFRLKEGLRLETSLGVGFMKTDYRRYEGVEDNKFLVWKYDGIYTWVGPVKAKVSMVWMINSRKGGRR